MVLPSSRRLRAVGCAVGGGTVGDSGVASQPSFSAAELRESKASEPDFGQLYSQLETQGFCVVPNMLDVDMVSRLKRVTNEMVQAEPEEKSRRFRSQGSMVAVPGGVDTVPLDTIFGQLITWKPALESLARMGFVGPATFTDGYVISKPAHSPPLFWHYDWFSWDQRIDWRPRPVQVFFMYYLHDTSPANGCLRAIPGSHCADNALVPLLGAPHTVESSLAKDVTAVQYSRRPDECDVRCRAGDLLIGGCARHALLGGVI